MELDIAGIVSLKETDDRTQTSEAVAIEIPDTHQNSPTLERLREPSGVPLGPRLTVSVPLKGSFPRTEPCSTILANARQPGRFDDETINAPGKKGRVESH